jgi:hypothetical protein
VGTGNARRLATSARKLPSMVVSSGRWSPLTRNAAPSDRALDALPSRGRRHDGAKEVPNLVLADGLEGPDAA